MDLVLDGKLTNDEMENKPLEEFAEDMGEFQTGMPDFADMGELSQSLKEQTIVKEHPNNEDMQSRMQRRKARSLMENSQTEPNALSVAENHAEAASLQTDGH